LTDFIKIPSKFRNVLMKKQHIREKFEKETKTKLKLNEEIEIEGDSINTYIAKNILRAFGRGISMDDALLLLNDEYVLEVIDLKEFANTENRLRTIRGRLIGTNGKTKKFIEKYTNTKIAISGKTASILGKWNDVPLAKEAVLMIIRGSTHSTLYRWLEQKTKVVKW